MGDRLRPAAYHLFVAAILGGLWVYADLQRQIAEGANYRLPSPDPNWGMRAERSWGPEGEVGQVCAPATRPARGTAITGVSLVEEIPE